MSSILHLSRFKGMSLVLRLVVVLAMVLSIFGLSVQPAFAAEVSEQLFPNPPAQLLNTGGQTELIWWTVTFDSTPKWIVHTIEDPTGSVISAATYTEDITGMLSPIYNPEDTNPPSLDPSGTHQGDGFVTWAHTWDVPAGARPGTYISRVRYYSVGSLLGEEPGPTNWENEAAQTFYVVQPLQIFKYYDQNGNGAYNAEPGLDTWHFDVSGPGWFYAGSVAPGDPAPTTTVFTGKDLIPQFPLAGDHLFVNSVDVGGYTVTDYETITNTGVFHLTAAMGAPPAVGVPITTSFTTFSGETSGGGVLILPNLQRSGTYTVTETMKPNWANTDPLGGPPVQKIIHVPGDIGTGTGLISPTDPIVYFGNIELAPQIQIIKKTNNTDNDSPPGLYIANVGDPVTWTYTVTNPGQVPLSNIMVTDNIAGVTPVYVSGDTNLDNKLDLTETWVYTATGTAILGQYSNIGTVVGTPPVGDNVSDTNPDNYYTAAPPPPSVPASSNLGIGLLIAVFGGIMTLFVYRRARQSQS